MRFPATAHDPAAPGGKRTVYIVRKIDAHSHGEVMVDTEGNTYRLRLNGHGLEPFTVPAAPTAPADPPPGMEPDERDELTAFLRTRRGASDQPDPSIERTEEVK